MYTKRISLPAENVDKMEEPSKSPKQSKPKAPKSPKGKFVKRMFIPGFGLVDQGDESSVKAYKAWTAWTKIPIENYLD
jgi:hypothetical protein